jgi:carbamate kinase
MLQIPCPSASTVGVVFIDKNRVVKIVHSSSDVVLQTTKHIMIYHGSGPSLGVIALRPAV